MRRVGLAVLVAVLHGVTLSRAAENPTFMFLRNDQGARAAALGGSFVSMTDDPNAIFYNPSALATLQQAQLSLGFFKHLLDINSGHLSYAEEILDFGFVGAGITYINYGDFTRTDELGNKLGTFTANELSASVGYAGLISPGVSYGASVKFIYSGIAEATSTAMAIDVGGLWSFPEQRMTLGVSLLNIGSQLDPYYFTHERLPLDLKIGATIQPEHLPLLLNLNFHKLNESASDPIRRLRAFSIGGEFLLSDNVRARFGYNNERRRDLKIGTSTGMAGFSFGAGFITGGYQIDYAFNSYGRIGSLNRISLAFLF
jgi:hypothetical protein